MHLLLIVGIIALAWCVLPLPLAVVIGRSFRAAEDARVDAAFAEIVRRYDTAEV